jgi:hypothetical protein
MDSTGVPVEDAPASDTWEGIIDALGYGVEACTPETPCSDFQDCAANPEVFYTRDENSYIHRGRECGVLFVWCSGRAPDHLGDFSGWWSYVSLPPAGDDPVGYVDYPCSGVSGQHECEELTREWIRAYALESRQRRAWAIGRNEARQTNDALRVGLWLPGRHDIIGPECHEFAGADAGAYLAGFNAEMRERDEAGCYRYRLDAGARQVVVEEAE